VIFSLLRDGLKELKAKWLAKTEKKLTIRRNIITSGLEAFGNDPG